jgi:hypothetical protein
MTGADLSPVHLGTGEVLERLDEQPPETLAEAFHLAQEREAEAKRWADALAAELRRRLKMRQARLVVFGDWEVESTVTRESVWDADELEGTLRRLVDEGVVRAGDVADVIVREPVVARAKAKALASRLDGDARAAVQAACTWREKPGKLTVARSVELLAPAPAEPPTAGDGRTPIDLDPQELFA